MRPNLESYSVSIPTGGGDIQGDLNVPAGSRAVILFAHGSGSSRLSPRNKYVAELLNHAGFSTLLLDLLTPDEELDDERTAHLRFDIDLLADRLVAATDWLVARPGPEARHIGYFGASTGAAAALVAAARQANIIEAVVSRGGRPDLAGLSLPYVQAPTLLIVGQFDQDVVELNREAANKLRVRHRIEIVPWATHLFEERGTLEQAADLAQRWFEDHLLKNKASVA